MLHNALSLTDLSVPPGNRLEKLRRTGKANTASGSISVGEFAFEWRDGDAHEVEIVDYH
jgi:proteic killer suppression protein